MIKIQRLKITNYRGIKSIEATDVPKGAIAKGRNSSGKTSVLNAIGAALAGADIGPDAVRLGERDGEILIDLDVAGQSLQVRRRFGARGSELTVHNQHGDKKAKPATLLADLLGTSPLDVIGVVLEKDKKKRRELVLSALPVSVTVEQLRRWVPKLPDDYDCSGHGLEVIERLRASAYEKRTNANRVAKEAERKAAELSREAPPSAPEVPDVQTLEREAREAERAHAAIVERDAYARRAVANGEALREQVRALRTRSEELKTQAESGPKDEDVTAADERVVELGRAYETMKRELEQLGANLERARAERRELFARRDEQNARRRQAAEATMDADRIEAGLAATTETVSTDEIHAAFRASEKALSRLQEARDAAGAKRRYDAWLTAKDEAEKARMEAERLDAIVAALTTVAPAALLAETPGVAAGLELDGDEIRLGGVSLDRLCGAEQMVFAADIARALNPGVGFLVVDGLERLDPEQLDAFVAAATSEGRQLFGSIVDRGELVLAAIESEQAEAAE